MGYSHKEHAEKEAAKKGILEAIRAFEKVSELPVTNVSVKRREGKPFSITIST